MNKEKLAEALRYRFGGQEIGESFGFPMLQVEKEQLYHDAHILLSEEPFRFDMLVCETAVDRNDYFELVCHLRSVAEGHEMILKTRVERGEMPVLASLCGLWQAAELFEDEVYDLFGIYFEHHPFLRRIMMDDDFQGYPLRKDFVNVEEL